MLCCKKRYLLKGWLIVFMTCYFSVVYAIRISGTVTNERNEPLPFVNVFIHGTSNGTSTNLDGKFFLDVADPGQYKIIFRYIGYKTHVESVTLLKENITLNITLQPQAIEIKEYTVSAKDEDPAYPIIRKAQQKRRFYQEQVKAYSYNSYIKGMSYLSNVPEKVMGRDIFIDGLDSTRSGIVYLSESVSEVFIQQPDQKKEIMISSKVSGRSQGFSWNSALDFELDFYSNNVPTPVTDRDIISPIAVDAKTYYRYKLLGDYEDQGRKIYKIEIIPKLTGSPLLNGTIHIQDETWRIHAINTYLTKNNGMNFLDTLWMNVIFIPINEDIWMKGTQNFRFNFNFKLFGIQGEGNFTGVFSNYQINCNFPPKFFTGEVVRIEEESNKKNEAYWDSIRPVPLTQTETKDYELKDSLEIIRETKAYKDSIDRKQNRFKFMNILTGYTWKKSYREIELYFSSPVMNFHFNTVEGINISQRIEFTKYFKDIRARLLAYGEVRYGFSGKRLYYKAGIRHRFNATNRMYVMAEGGRFVTQFNDQNPITPIQNSFYTIFFEENFMKLYEKYYGEAGWGMEVTNGIFLEGSIEYAWRRPLINSPELTPFFVNWQTRHFSSNHPLEPLTPNAPFTSHTAFIIQLHARFTFRQKYMMRPKLKINYDSKYPVIDLVYKRGIPGVGNSLPNYDYIQLNISQNINTGILGETEYDAGGGWFITQKQLTFADFHHFNTTQTIFAHRNDLSSFRALPYYRFSTNEWFAELHAQHHFKGWFLGKIPGIKKLKWHEVIGFHFLYTPQLNDYYEFTVGLENIFRIFRADFAGGFIRGESPYFTGRIKINW